MPAGGIAGGGVLPTIIRDRFWCVPDFEVEGLGSKALPPLIHTAARRA